MTFEIFRGRPPHIPYANRARPSGLPASFRPRFWSYPFGKEELRIELVDPYKRLYLFEVDLEGKHFSWFSRLPKINREVARKQLSQRKAVLLLLSFDPRS